ncbi:PREDICTED: sprT-like domain-containing protein Spartan [Vollenhovia emeryi]|uniref:sprT-like domain-containing protein Spartan n=1 Tax=Vollenhovia emeryi TaxID=411798 RepID=UPI0005F58B84|nr:PREDICTED: sprT-like domain-containing protein Spartan [Vollenhovia emeryi]
MAARHEAQDFRVPLINLDGELTGDAFQDVFFSLVDKRLDLIDPIPNIHALFVQFDERFFRNMLAPVEVKWSNKMTSSAGVCTFRSGNQQCVISLSVPLLKLRPRKDLIETLLHEMIHAYLFLTNNDRDRDGHGPNFCKHMHRINKEAGTNITIYHNFHEEVKLYKQHWWKCNGPCQNKPPYFGTVRRSMNRPPGPSDFWWSRHQQNCNGQFIKIKEPENFKSRSKQNNKSKSTSKDNKPNRSITNWITKTIPVMDAVASTSSKVLANNMSNIPPEAKIDRPSTSKDNGDTNSSQETKKLGSSSNNVHGWGISGPSGNAKMNNAKTVSKNATFSCSGVLGGSTSGRSNLLTKFQQTNDDKSRQGELVQKNSSSESSSGQEPANNPSQPRNNSAPCPLCNITVTTRNIYSHIDSCLIHNSNTSLVDEINNNINNNNNSEELMLPIRTFSRSIEEDNVDAYTSSNKRFKSDTSNETVNYATCPVCDKRLPATDIHQHVDECLLEAERARKAAIPSTSRASYDEENPKAAEQICLVCNAQIAPESSLNEHLEECIESIFEGKMMMDDTLAIETNSLKNEYPCPVCMEIIQGNLMHQHLDMCLKNE